MKRDEALKKVQALWPDHELTGLPMSALGVIKILEALDLIDFKEKKDAKPIEAAAEEVGIPDPKVEAEPETETPKPAATPSAKAKKAKE